MQTFRMNANLLHGFLEALKRWGTLVAPVERAPGVFALAEIDDVTTARPDALRTILPFKKLLWAPQVTMLEGRGGEMAAEKRGGPIGRWCTWGRTPAISTRSRSWT